MRIWQGFPEELTIGVVGGSRITFERMELYYFTIFS